MPLWITRVVYSFLIIYSLNNQFGYQMNIINVNCLQPQTVAGYAFSIYLKINHKYKPEFGSELPLRRSLLSVNCLLLLSVPFSDW